MRAYKFLQTKSMENLWYFQASDQELGWLACANSNHLETASLLLLSVLHSHMLGLRRFMVQCLLREF